MFEEIWESKPVVNYRDYIDKNYHVYHEHLSPNVYYKVFINIKTKKSVRVKNYIYKYFSSYTHEGITKSFDREIKEQIRCEINFILKLLRTTT